MKKILSCCLLSVSLGFALQTKTIYADQPQSINLSIIANDEIKISSKILNFQINQEILKRVQKTTGFSAEKTARLAVELKRYFVLCYLYKNISIPKLSSSVYEALHAFLLFTKDYEYFCKETLGYFLHHIPTTEVEKSARTTESAMAAKENFINLYTALFGETPNAEIWFDATKSCSSCSSCGAADKIESCGSCGGGNCGNTM